MRLINVGFISNMVAQLFQTINEIMAINDGVSRDLL